MADVTVRIYEQTADGHWADRQLDFGLKSFAGFLPAIGDMIVDPGVLQGLNRHDAVNRRLWTVVGRVFNPRDLEDYVALMWRSGGRATRKGMWFAGDVHGLSIA